MFRAEEQKEQKEQKMGRKDGPERTGDDPDGGRILEELARVERCACGELWEGGHLLGGLVGRVSGLRVIEIDFLGVT